MERRDKHSEELGQQRNCSSEAKLCGVRRHFVVGVARGELRGQGEGQRNYLSAERCHQSREEGRTGAGAEKAQGKAEALTVGLRRQGVVLGHRVGEVVLGVEEEALVKHMG